MDILTKQMSTLVHFKESEPVAVTFANGTTKLYELKEMGAAQVEAFYEADKAN